MSDFGADEIRIGEALYRSEAHLAAACELYGAGRKPDALLQAARPITDVLPWLETEVRSGEDASLKRFFEATASFGAEIRRDVRPRALRRALGKVEAACEELLAATVGPLAADQGYRASVALALLEGAAMRYRAGVDEESLGDYQSAYALASAGTDVLRDAGATDDPSVGKLIASIDAVFPSVSPPERLARPEDVDGLVAEVVAATVETFGARALRWTLREALGKIERLLADVVDAYDDDLGPLAARLASSLFVRAYDPIRHEIAAVAPDVEARLTSLLGFELRRAINDDAAVDDILRLTTEAHELLVTLRAQPATRRGTPSASG